MTSRPIYLDYQSTTPCDPDVLKVMLPFFTDVFGNAHATNHAWGWDAEEAVDFSREKIAHAINADRKEIIFTSGATEANNLAIKGIAGFYHSKKRHIITVSTEHRCVLEACSYLEQNGFLVTILPVDSFGLIDCQRLEEAITEDTLLVSVMAVNNEIGVIQPLSEIGALCRAKSVFFHCDAAQALGRIPLDVEAMKIDLMSLSGHKIYGPKGIGALYIRKRPRTHLVPLFHGGGQENGIRSGTLPVPLCVGMGEAAALASSMREQDYKKIGHLRDLFLTELQNNLSDFIVNGDRVKRIPGNLSLSFPRIDGRDLLPSLRDVAVSAGSSCNTIEREPSHVLRAIGVSSELAVASLRIGFGRQTTPDESKLAAQIIAKTVISLQK
jgi:cysteine desulfurase